MHTHEDTETHEFSHVLALNLPLALSVLRDRDTALHKNRRCLTSQMMSQCFNLRTEESSLEKYCELKLFKCI